MDVRQATDKELIAGFLKGSDQCFEELISRYEGKAYNLAMRLTRNPEDAEEVLQDVFVTVYRKLESFEGKSAFSSWLYRITVNAAFMKLRKRKSKPSVSLEEVFPQFLNGDAVEDSYMTRPDNQVSQKELRIALGQAVDRLPEEYRAVFILRDVDGLSNKEASEVLGISIPAVKSRLHRSRVMLRRKLSRWYDAIRQDRQILATPSLAVQSWTAV